MLSRNKIAMQKFISERTSTITCSHTLFFLLLFISFSVMNGQEIEIKNGVNIQASYYNGGVVNIGWELMEDYPEIEAVRIEIEPNRALQSRTWIREAQDNNYQVIATFHDSKKLGSNKIEDLREAAKWWRNNYKILSSNSPFIINIMNEWGDHSITPLEYATAYNEIIPIIREVYDGPLIVDVPGFGQATKIAADAFALFEDDQLIFSVHIYAGAFNVEKNRWLNESDLSYLAETGATCMVGEFCDAGRGGADWCSLVDYCYQNDWPLFGWAWNGDGGIMNMIEPHWRDQPFAASFNPTPLMDRIVSKLAGVPCFTSADETCSDQLIGTPCNDNNEYTINDRYNEHCHCTGSFTNFLQTSIAEPSLLIFPNPIGENSQLFIEFIKTSRPGWIFIFNSVGKKIGTFPKAASQQSVIIDANNLENGIYWAVFQVDGKNQFSRAFIK